MAIPKTYLFTAPHDAPDTVGRGIEFSAIITGLRKCNPRISVWQQYPDDIWWPGKAVGKTCLWLGEPGGTSIKISAINPGLVPEFTQIAPDGKIIMKGWRAIFDKVVRCGAATRSQIELAFNVSLAVLGQDLLCQKCAINGKRNPHNGGKSGLCKWHERIANAADMMIAARAIHDLEQRFIEESTIQI